VNLVLGVIASTNKELKVKSAKLLLNKEGYFGVDVDRSDMPYRGQVFPGGQIAEDLVHLPNWVFSCMLV